MLWETGLLSRCRRQDPSASVWDKIYSSCCRYCEEKDRSLTRIETSTASRAGVHPPVSYLCATVEAEQLDVSAVLSKRSGKNKSGINNALLLFKTGIESRRLFENRDLKEIFTWAHCLQLRDILGDLTFGESLHSVLRCSPPRGPVKERLGSLIYLSKSCLRKIACVFIALKLFLLFWPQYPSGSQRGQCAASYCRPELTGSMTEKRTTK